MTRDIILGVNEFPIEDTKTRTRSIKNNTGGNVYNTLNILSQLNHSCAWAGTVSNDAASKCACEEMTLRKIDISHRFTVDDKALPTSYIINNQENASRTIIHHRNLPEFPYAQFQEINLDLLDWIHFEGRNVNQVKKMMSSVKETHPSLPISLECETRRENIESLYPFANTIFFSKNAALSYHCKSAVSLLKKISKTCPTADLICSWGENGAWARSMSGNTFSSKAFIPDKIVETLGAGDTFNAGIINALLNQKSLENALVDACQLAGQKCGQEGFNLGDIRL